MSLLTLYRPTFCDACGAKIIRLRWHLWTSRRHCDKCRSQFRQQQWAQSILAIGMLLSVGMLIGHTIRPAPPPLVIQRVASSGTHATQAGATQPEVTTEDEVYLCGARTRKGTPCSRRVHGPVRCWQHKGMTAMLPPEKLRIKE